MKKEYISTSVDLSDESLETIIKRFIKDGENKENLTKALLGALREAGSVSRSLVVQAYLDVGPWVQENGIIDYKIGDYVYMNANVVSDWHWDKPFMKSVGILIETDHKEWLQARITDINHFAEKAFTVEYKYLKENLDKSIHDEIIEEAFVSLYNISPLEEYPENITTQV